PPLPSYSGGCSAAPLHVALTTPPPCTASYFLSSAALRPSSNDSATIVITPAASLTKVAGGTFPFDGSAHAAGVLVTGAGSLSLTPSPKNGRASCRARVHIAEATATACKTSYRLHGEGDKPGNN